MKKIASSLSTIVFIAIFSACSSQPSAEAPSATPTSSPADSLPSIESYQPVADEAEALAQLTEEEITSYRDILCSSSSFADVEDIASIKGASQEEKIQAVHYVNDAPAVVRQISDRNKQLSGSEGMLQKPLPSLCS